MDTFGYECFEIGFVQSCKLIRSACLGQLLSVSRKIGITAVNDENHHGLILRSCRESEKIISMDVRHSLIQRLVIPYYDHSFIREHRISPCLRHYIGSGHIIAFKAYDIEIP